jgi:ABC-2 type transport system ATP-binding protein
MIRIQDLVKQFRRNRVLDGLTLAIEPGERIALVGSNGAGKTTLIRCLLGEYTHEGTVLVNGIAPRSGRARVLHDIGFVPQLPPALKMPVGELIGFAAAVCGSPRARVEEVAAELGLDTRAMGRQPFHKLSGGQKQKLLIAIALGREARVLIMDEPAANLDPDARHRFFDMLAQRQDHTTMLISSHRLDEVAPLVNRVIELDRGRVVLDDRVADATLDGRVGCRLGLRRPEEAIARALTAWGFRDMGGGIEWAGTIPGADRLRFMGLLSRYVGVLTRISITEIEENRSWPDTASSRSAAS